MIEKLRELYREMGPTYLHPRFYIQLTIGPHFSVLGTKILELDAFDREKGNKWYRTRVGTVVKAVTGRRQAGCFEYFTSLNNTRPIPFST